MMKNNSHTTGSILITVLVICSLLLFVGISVFTSMQATVHQSGLSLQGLQAKCLAEAALERCFLLIRERGNKPNGLSGKKEKPDSFQELSFWLRKPAAKSESATAQKTGLITEDFLLDLGKARPITFSKSDLLLDKGGKDRLDALVAFMTKEMARDWQVKITFEPLEFFRNGPATADKEYLVPGIELPWNVRKDVFDFIEGKGFVQFYLKFPAGLKLFNFSIPLDVGVMGLKINVYTIDVLSVMDSVIGKIDGLGTYLETYIPSAKEDRKFATKLMELDTIAHIYFNKLRYPESDPPVYPYAFTLDHIKFPKHQDLWPEAAKVSLPAEDAANKFYIEKYGAVKVVCEASITDHTGHKTTRRIEAQKEVRVSDIEPPAPMYSFFVENRSNQYLYFDNMGGEFYVNSRDLKKEMENLQKGAGSKQRQTPKAEEKTSEELPKADDADEAEEIAEDPEIPGLIRLNFQNGESDPPLLVSTNLLGNPFSLSFGGEGNMVTQMIQGFEGLLTLDLAVNMTLMAGKCTMRADYHPPMGVKRFMVKARRIFRSGMASWGKTKPPDETQWKQTGIVSEAQQKKLQEKKLAEEKSDGVEKDPAKKGWTEIRSPSEAKAKNNAAQEKYDKWEKGFKGAFSVASKLNCVPDVFKMSCDPRQFLLYLATRPVEGTLKGSALQAVINALDIFQSWEVPWMGSSNTVGTLPIPLWSIASTHLFGMMAAYPTLTREIEGKVVKRYRQWRMAILGLKPADRILIPKPPFIFPPFPIPMWYTGEILNKYDYNLPLFKSFDPDSGVPTTDIHVYDPGLNENLAPNLYTTEQYAKKASHYYSTPEKFLEDLPQRLIKLSDGREAFLLDGVNFISGSLGSPTDPFCFGVAKEAGKAAQDFYVIGRGMIVVTGNIFLGVSIKRAETKGKNGVTKPTVFSLMSREGGVMTVGPDTSGISHYVIEGSVFTERGLFVPARNTLQIRGNWVTNSFRKANLMGNVVVDYASSHVRSSLGSLHPQFGKFDPARYHVSFSPVWKSWKVD